MTLISSGGARKAKGREWRCVLLPGLTEGRCPAQERGDVLPGSEAEPDGIEQSPWIEQERRIFYVGLTRASERVYLQASPSAPSRFLEEMRGVWSGERGRQAASSPSPRASGAAWTEAGINYAHILRSEGFGMLSAGINARYLMGHAAGAFRWRPFSAVV